MPKFTVDKIRKMMEQRENIRNISVIAHVDHGKSTLTDSLIYKAGILAKQQTGNAKFTDKDKQEIARGITIKSASVSLYYEKYNRSKQTFNPYLINLIDSPGHVDFSSEVTAALRVTDGALVVVDCIEGVCVQTTTVLKQAISERIRPILFLNKLDRSFLEKQSNLEECYLTFRKAIESVNVVTQTYKDDRLGEIQLYPQNGTVGFGSGLHAWGFTLKDFARMYHVKFAKTGLSKKNLMEKFWGENYWDPSKNQWVTHNPGHLERGFCQFVLKPIKVLCDSIMAEQKDIYEPIIDALQLNISNKEIQQCKKPKDYLKLVMQTWLPCGDALLDMIVEHLPSPNVAQQYRVETLYTGPLDSPEAMSIRQCNPKGPLGMYISKLIPGDAGRFVAFGRVFSGTVKPGQKVRIMGNEYTIGSNQDLSVDRIQNTLLIMGAETKALTDGCPAGNVVGLTGIDKYLSKSGTITDCETFFPLKTMKFSVAPVVQVAVAPKKPSDLPKLTEGLRRLSKSDQTIKVWQSKSGENIVAGAGELHLQVCLTNLTDDFMKGCEIKVSEPVVSYSETISGASGSYQNYPSVCVAKSPNKLNRLYCQAMPLSQQFIKHVEKGTIKMPGKDNKVFARNLSENYGWNNDDARKIWTFGRTKDTLANVIVEATKGVQYLNEVKDNVCEAFHEFTECGVLCGENVRGVRMDIKDVLIHSDRSHRGTSQIIPASKKVFQACQIASGAIMLEPMFLVDISVPSNFVESVTRVIRSRRGQISMIEPGVGTPLTAVQAFLPVKESFGVTADLRQATSGNAFPQMVFSHWEKLPGDPFDSNSLAHKVIIDIRRRKGDKLQLPNFNDFYDKIN